MAKTVPVKQGGSTATPPVTIPPRVFASRAAVADVGYRKADKAVIADTEAKYFNASVKDLRVLPAWQAIRILTRTNGTFSAALNAYLQLAMSSGYKVTGYVAGTHQFDPTATLAAQSIIASMDTLYDYTLGYSSKQSISGLLETLLKEVLQTGGCMTELVLNPYRLPEAIIPIPLNTIEWITLSNGRRFPRQRPLGGGDLIDLDYPTICYAASAQQSNSIFPRSMFESALNMLFQHEELMEDIFRVIRRTGHTRMVVKIIQASVENMASPEVRDDPAKMADFFESVRVELEKNISALDPQDAVVTYDNVEMDSMGTAGDKADYSAVLDTMNGMLASSLKTMPSMLGMRMAGSQSLSNTESLTFLKLVQGIRLPIETVLSRTLTLAVRLVAGVDSYVKFEFNPVEIRPEAELSAHRAVLMQDIMRKLSLGYLTDDEAAHKLGMFPRAPGAPNLSGTQFMNCLLYTSPSPRD